MKVDEIANNISGEFKHWTVADLVTLSGDWDIVNLKNWPLELVHQIMAIAPPGNEGGDDEFVWPAQQKDKFSVRYTYRLLCKFCQRWESSTWKKIWKLRVKERTRCFI